MNIAGVFLRSAGRVALLMVLSAVGTIALMRFAPGYFSDAREMDAKYAAEARAQQSVVPTETSTLRGLVTSTVAGWLHGDLGRSRQYEIPVTELIRPRLRVTAGLLVRGILCGWVLAFFAAILLSTGGGWAAVLGVPFTLLLAIPCGAMATLCLLANTGGPVLVLSLLLAARDFKFLQKLMRAARSAPHLLQARAQGMRASRVLARHVLPSVLPQVLAIGTLSLVTALSAIVPIEVIFDVPGVGQLAWTAASNRDLPVLLAITLLMSAAVGAASMLSDRRMTARTA